MRTTSTWEGSEPTAASTEEQREQDGTSREPSADGTQTVSGGTLQGLSDLGLLTASAAHDLNNALAALRAYLYVAQVQLGRPQALSECQAILDRCSSLTGWLLAISSSDPGGTVAWRGPPAELRDCVSGALTFLRHSLPSDIQVETDLGEQPFRVPINRELMCHALFNLLLNARDALSAGGGVIMTRLRLLSEDAVQLIVEDGGVGMDAATLQRAMEPLFTTKGATGSTGLGLPSVLRVVQAAGGTVELTSQLGAGTRVTLTLPRTAAESE